MLNLVVNGVRVMFDSLEEAREASLKSGLGLAFWRETLVECVADDALWNEFINGLAGIGDVEREKAECLDCAFPEGAPRHWFLVALILDADDPCAAFLAEWKSRGEKRLLPVVRSPAFGPWLKQVRHRKYDLLVRAFGSNAPEWPTDALMRALTASDAASDVDGARPRAGGGGRSEPRPGAEMTVVLPGGAKMTMVWCPATTSRDWKELSGGADYFKMGSPASEAGRGEDEEVHRVTLTEGFWMGKYAVTQAQWESVMMTNRSRFRSPDRPVERVSWEDCRRFAEEVSAGGKIRASLPTEAQWEYACRAGTTTSLPNGTYLRIVGRNNGPELDGIAWYGGNSCVGFDLPDGASCSGMEERQYAGARAGTHPVGKKSANAWNLHDMIGNVWEWCQDRYDEGYYAHSPAKDPLNEPIGGVCVCRGGAWSAEARDCRCARRLKRSVGSKGNYIGFRLVCAPGPR